MKKLLYGLIIAILVITLSGAIVYKFFLPTIIAKTMASRELPDFIPERVKTKIESVKRPLNENAQTVISTIHKSGITFDQIMIAIDEAKEEQAYAMLEELNRTKITSVDQVFDMGKKYFPVDFDVEVFRAAYRQKASLPLIEKAIQYANNYKNEKLMDTQTAKEIVKQILKTKEDEFNKIISNKNQNP
jgi:cellobiose-specific phosphotransferase system component IIA